MVDDHYRKSLHYYLRPSFEKLVFLSNFFTNHILMENISILICSGEVFCYINQQMYTNWMCTDFFHIHLDGNSAFIHLVHSYCIMDLFLPSHLPLYPSNQQKIRNIILCTVLIVSYCPCAPEYKYYGIIVPVLFVQLQLYSRQRHRQNGLTAGVTP